jgi:hypothetical protein
MNWLFRYASLPLVAAAWAASAFTASAGDAIIFSTGKAKTDAAKVDPEKKDPAGKELRKPWEDISSVNPHSLSGLTMPSLPGPRKITKEEKQMRNAQDEKRNWLLLRPGQLNEEQEEKENSGMRDYDLQREDNKGKRDYTFHGLTDRKERPAGAGNSSANSRAAAEARNAKARQVAAEESAAEERKMSSSESDRRNQQLGDHTAKELDLRNLFGSGKSGSAPNGGNSGYSLKEILGADSPSRSREQQARLSEFKQMLDGPRSASAGDRWDLGRAPSTPAFSKPLEGPGRSGNSIFTPPADFNVPSAPRGLPGMSDWNSQRSPGLPRGTQPAPSFAPPEDQPVRRPSVIRPTVMEIPQRKF